MDQPICHVAVCAGTDADELQPPEPERLVFPLVRGIRLLRTGGQGHRVELPTFRFSGRQLCGLLAACRSAVKPAGEVRSLIANLIQLRPPRFSWALSAVPPQVADGDDPR